MISKDPLFVEQQLQAFYSQLKEREQRHYAAVEVLKLGHGGKNISWVFFRFIIKRFKERFWNELVPN